MGCFRYPNSTSHIQYGTYVRHNLSTYSCALICEKEIGLRTPFSLSKKTLCHCDSHLEDFKITKQVADEYCRYRCTNALPRTEYCGHFDTMAVYAAEDGQRLITILLVVGAILLPFVIPTCIYALVCNTTSNNRRKRQCLGFSPKKKFSVKPDGTGSATNENKTLCPMTPIPRGANKNNASRGVFSRTSVLLETKISPPTVSSQVVLHGEQLVYREDYREDVQRREYTVAGGELEREVASSSRTDESPYSHQDQASSLHQAGGYECLGQTNEIQDENSSVTVKLQSQHPQPLPLNVKPASVLMPPSPKYASIKATNAIANRSTAHLTNAKKPCM
ncbi:hypothetical protein HOLleu_23421 [Holothuria leucospilota]|uniref:WSC domain-containing protein n=1 Tax=Holothuria leucospilota TaxID=206669 RepID=A0A9Q1BVC3_HOLLE|nr:hypothetical protein HOLleu_23421 [Holothuria leucospilota]